VTSPTTARKHCLAASDERFLGDVGSDGRESFVLTRCGDLTPRTALQTTRRPNNWSTEESGQSGTKLAHLSTISETGEYFSKESYQIVTFNDSYDGMQSRLGGTIRGSHSRALGGPLIYSHYNKFLCLALHAVKTSGVERQRSLLYTLRLVV